MRILSFERIYPLRQYENLKFYDQIDLSIFGEKEALNSEIYNLARYLQFIQTELAYRKYLELLKNLNELNLEDSILYLETQRVTTIDMIKEMILDKIQKEE
jgi:hypothetical protein